MGISTIDNGQFPWAPTVEALLNYVTPGQGDGITTFGDARTRLNAAATALGLPTIGNDTTAQIRAKINAMIEGTGVPAEADLYLDFLNGRYFGGTPTDTHATDILALSSTGYETFGPNVLPRTDLGLLTTVTQTNLFLNSDAPATQSVTISNATVYTVRVWGSGSITLSGAATGTVEEGSPVTFTSSGTSLTLTVSGTLDYVMLVAASFATDPIITEGSAVTRPGNRPVVPVPDGARAFVFDLDVLQPAPESGFPRAFCYSDGSSSDRFEILFSSTGNMYGSMFKDGVQTGGISYPEVGALLPNRLTVYGAASEGYWRFGYVGGVDKSPTTPPFPAAINLLAFGSEGYNTAGNSYSRSRRFAEIRNITDPEAAFAHVKALAQNWHANLLA